MKLTIMIGISASGKSSVAEYFANTEKNTLRISSDNLREEMYGDANQQGDHKELFEIMNNKTKELLDNGVNVVYDATNTNRKKRIHLMNTFAKGHEVEAVYMSTPYEDCFQRNLRRERPVPVASLKRMFKNLHVPMMSEGYDNIRVIRPSTVENFSEAMSQSVENALVENAGYYSVMTRMLLMDEFRNIWDLPQDNPNHSFSVSRHTYHLYDYLHGKYEQEDIQHREYLKMLWSAIFHDLGKSFCKSFKNFKGEKTRYANFIGHENVSAQYAVQYLLQLGYSKDFALEVAQIVQLHMRLMNAKSEKSMRKLQKLSGKVTFEQLQVFYEADKKAK